MCMMRCVKSSVMEVPYTHLVIVTKMCPTGMMPSMKPREIFNLSMELQIYAAMAGTGRCSRNITCLLTPSPSLSSKSLCRVR